MDDLEVLAAGKEPAEFLGGFAGGARNLVLRKRRDAARKKLGEISAPVKPPKSGR